MAKQDQTTPSLIELLGDRAWIADQHVYYDGDIWPIFPGRVAEYVHQRGALVVRQDGKEIGHIPVFGNRRG